MAKKRTSENELVVSSGAMPVPARRKTAVPHKTHAPTNVVTEPLAEPVAPPVAIYKPTREDIAALAYSYWVARGFQAGSPEEDWLRAEDELSRTAHTATA
jgi:hypothetical protein